MSVSEKLSYVVHFMNTRTHVETLAHLLKASPGEHSIEDLCRYDSYAVVRTLESEYATKYPLPALMAVRDAKGLTKMLRP